jgi:hypothetical protein
LLGVASFGAVRIGDVEQEVHNTPTTYALREIASIMAGVDAPSNLQIQNLKYQVATPGGTVLTSDYVWLQATSSSTPGYIKGWGWATLTGLTGFQGSAVGFCLTVTFTSTITGTLSNIIYSGACQASVDPSTGLVSTVCSQIFTSSLSAQVSSGQLITLSSTIVSGISGWSIIGSYGGYAGSITTVSASPDFLRNASMLFLPSPIASIPSATGARGYLRYFVLGGSSYPLGVRVGTAQLSYYTSVSLGSYLSPSSYVWVGGDTLYVSYPSSSTLILYNTLVASFSTPLTLLPGGTAYFTLVLTYSS